MDFEFYTALIRQDNSEKSVFPITAGGYRLIFSRNSKHSLTKYYTPGIGVRLQWETSGPSLIIRNYIFLSSTCASYRNHCQTLGCYDLRKWIDTYPDCNKTPIFIVTELSLLTFIIIIGWWLTVPFTSLLSLNPVVTPPCTGPILKWLTLMYIKSMLVNFQSVHFVVYEIMIFEIVSCI